MNFDELNWHDSILKNISIDRSNPGIIDSISLEIVWSPDFQSKTLIFQNVYWANLNLNFGIVADESIMNAYILNEDDQDFKRHIYKWKDLIPDIKLKMYKVQLNSTSSEIKIIAANYVVR